MTTKAPTPPQTEDDPFCHCGYRRSIHGEPPCVCRKFSYSVFFNEMQVSEAWLRGEKELAAKRAKARKSARH